MAVKARNRFSELSEGRKRVLNASYLDDWPVIFRNFSAAGYATAFAEEMASYGFWIYKLKGFRVPPADFWLQSFERATIGRRSWFPEFCQGDTPRALVLCDFWEELQSMYEPQGVNTFSVLMSGETSHDDYNRVQGLDAHWVEKFRSQCQRGMFNNTFVIFMGDHGRRFGDVRQTQSGKLEEKLPLLIMIPPPWFREQYPDLFQNMISNTNKLITVFDLHATFQNILSFHSASINRERSPEELLSQRAISLFHPVPPARTCADAWIGPHYCSCLSWNVIDIVNDRNLTTFDVAQSATLHVIGEINGILEEAKEMCAVLSLRNITGARRIFPNQELMAFAGNLDYDNTVPDLTADTNLAAVDYEELMSFTGNLDYDNTVPDLTADTNLAAVDYKVQFETEPNDARFEALVRYYTDSKEFEFKFGDLSRLDQYKGQSACIEDTHHNLKPYCYCVELLS